MLPYLDQDSPFPGVDQALEEPNGLLAAGADLSSERLLYAYSNGIFPWYSSGEPILWWSPDPRAVFFVDTFKAHKSVRKTIKQYDLRISLNQDFAQVIEECAAPRGEDPGTWLTIEMISAYKQLHREGHAHSVEVWRGEELVGGIYGVAANGTFCGESMFSRVSNGSKIALSCLIGFIRQLGFKLVDCQIENPHLESLGCALISRDLYLQLLAQNKMASYDNNAWNAKTLDWQSLIRKRTHV